jgi:hypothetical protein
MVEKVIPKDPNSVLDYGFNYAGDEDHESYLEDGETISSHVVTVDAGMTKDSDSEDGGWVVVWISGGTAGTAYTVACKITTNMGRTEERSILIRCEER